MTTTMTIRTMRPIMSFSFRNCFEFASVEFGKETGDRRLPARPRGRGFRDQHLAAVEPEAVPMGTAVDQDGRVVADCGSRAASPGSGDSAGGCAVPSVEPAATRASRSERSAGQLGDLLQLAGVEPGAPQETQWSISTPSSSRRPSARGKPGTWRSPAQEADAQSNHSGAAIVTFVRKPDWPVAGPELGAIRPSTIDTRDRHCSPGRRVECCA